MTDVIDFCSKLVEFNTVTPAKKDVFDFLADFLDKLSFETRILKSGDVYNLFAKKNMSDSQKSLGFLAHVDVVPAGENWDFEPFRATQKDGFLIGRGVCDMKSGLAAFCCALEKTLENLDGGIEIFVTGDEEIGSYDGVQSLLDWTKRNEKFPQYCLIGEPSSIETTGDRVYLGHRGSINVEVLSHGKQGHVAFPAGFDNSLSKLCNYIAKMKAYKWHDKNSFFPPTNLEPTLLYSKNYAVNVVPDESFANINIRFSDSYTNESLKQILQRENSDHLELKFHCNGEAYCCQNDTLKNMLSEAIFEATGLHPEFSGAGGTSDGRFMKDYCDVIEFGVPDTTMHQKNEKAKITDIYNLEKTYVAFLEKYFA